MILFDFQIFDIFQVCNIFDYLGALSSAVYGLIMISIAMFFIFGSVTIVKKAKMVSDRKIQEEEDKYEISDKLRKLQKLDIERYEKERYEKEMDKERYEKEIDTEYSKKKTDIEDSVDEYRMKKF